jgi:hypothetical protein
LTAGIVLISVEESKVIQPDIWIGTEKTPTVFHPAFTMVTTCATSVKEFREKCVRLLENYGWKLLGVEQANPGRNEGGFSEEVEEILARTRTNPNWIIYGAFHSYPAT